KSKIRDHCVFATRFTQTATVKLCTLPSSPEGSLAYPEVPLSCTALVLRPGTKVAPPISAAGPPAGLPEESAADVPVDSSNRYQATTSGAGPMGVDQYTV